MKKIIFSFLLLLSTSAFAWTIGPMNYQGRLLDNAGVPVTGSYNFKVRIYDAASGGTLKFSEQHNGVAVDDGVYSFLVSTGTNSTGAWDIALWNTPALYLEIEVNSETLTPRHLLASAPFAFQANLALTTNNALALGGKPSSWFNSTLEAICVSGKGKWLELANAGAGACLGVGTSFPGPTQVDWNTLTATSNFRNLDLSRADISGINFGAAGGANLMNTVFKDTTYSVQGMSGANLKNTSWDGAIATDASAVNVAATTDLSGATMKNMAMDKWNLGWMAPYSALYTNFSAAYLSACPTGFFSQWECRLMRASGSKYFMAGPYANLSATSALATTSAGASVLDVRDIAFNNLPTNNASFVGITLTQKFLNGNMYQADLSYATLKNIQFQNVNFAGSIFIGAKLEDVAFVSGNLLNLLDMSEATLNRVNFIDNLSTPTFTKASLRQVDFGNLGGAKFTSATLEDVRIHTQLYANPAPYDVVFDGTTIYGDFYAAVINSPEYFTMKDVSFLGGKVTGSLTDLTFTGTISFKNVIFKNLDLCSTVFPLVDTSAPHTDLATVKWEGPVECPNGDDVSGGTGNNTCDFTGLTRMTQTAVGNCTAGIP